MDINQEKQKIISCPDNVLVTANPGTGKTLLLAHKYIDLLRNGFKPEEILCLTFTKKAKKEMEERIFKLLKQENIEINLSNLNVHTFHSYALGNIEEADLVSPNLLRYSIFRYLKDNDILNYSDKYLLETIVPQMRNLIQYLKSFGITPQKIDITSTKELITDFKNYSKKDLERFLDYFTKTYSFYEQIKTVHGFDYTDMLINFLDLSRIPQYRYVLIDELQDVNKLEADIALKSGKNFVAVGDQKQAIFGFQGGSILNFDKFQDSTSFVLSENFRSTNAILYYAREYFSEKTKQDHHIQELKDLANNEMGLGDKPIILDVPRDEIHRAIYELLEKIIDEDKKIAVIARTNIQILRISKELQKRGMDHSSTFLSASSEARKDIVTYLRGLISRDIQYVKDAMFTPFFPISLQDAFELSEKNDLSLEEIYKKSFAFKKIRESINNVEDIDTVFQEKIIPVSISYGEDYFLASLTIMEAFRDAIELVTDKKIGNILAFLESTDLSLDEPTTEKNVLLTTVHKAKGKQFDTVIYVPSKPSDVSNFQDAVIKAILQSKGINAEEELEEEPIRIDFVAFTRAKEKLYIVTEKPNEYVNNFAEINKLEVREEKNTGLFELKKRAYTLFVNRQFDEAKKLLETKKHWIKNFVQEHFRNLERISFSALKTNPYEYFKSNILNLRITTPATKLGNNVHKIAEKILKKEEYIVPLELEQYKTNIEKLINKISNQYPQFIHSEEKILVPLSTLIETDSSLFFKGSIDAIFKNDNDEFFIVDWKTSKKKNYGSEYRRQLSVYKRIYSISQDIPLEKIRIAIGYVGLRKTINDGKISAELDTTQPSSTAYETFLKHVNVFLSWKKDINVFFDGLAEVNGDEILLRSILEQYYLEK